MSTGPGWFVHPSNPNIDVYWNGDKWTGSRLKSHAPADQPAAPDGTRLPAAPPGYSAVPHPVKQPLGCLGFVGIAVGVIVVLVVIGSVIGSLNANNGPSEPSLQAAAQVGCENLARQNLKAPSTASFSNESTTGASGHYTISGDVDAQNSFGAMLRNHFVCDVNGSNVVLRSMG